MNLSLILEDGDGTEGMAGGRWHRNGSQGREGKDVSSSDVESA